MVFDGTVHHARGDTSEEVLKSTAMQRPMRVGRRVKPLKISRDNCPLSIRNGPLRGSAPRSHNTPHKRIAATTPGSVESHHSVDRKFPGNAFLDSGVNTDFRNFRGTDSPKCFRRAQNAFLSELAQQAPT